MPPQTPSEKVLGSLGNVSQTVNFWTEVAYLSLASLCKKAGLGATGSMCAQCISARTCSNLLGTIPKHDTWDCQSGLPRNGQGWFEGSMGRHTWSVWDIVLPSMWTSDVHLLRLWSLCPTASRTLTIHPTHAENKGTNSQV